MLFSFHIYLMELNCGVLRILAPLILGLFTSFKRGSFVILLMPPDWLTLTRSSFLLRSFLFFPFTASDSAFLRTSLSFNRRCVTSWNSHLLNMRLTYITTILAILLLRTSSSPLSTSTTLISLFE
eukprot:Pompholyxophrys_punicea_v1_NODE_1148_length_907_cov_9.529274.p1 type:complete len:125 gc:universal NODE_1148_length_907_cov_9.529274:349-723(+)